MEQRSEAGTLVRSAAYSLGREGETLAVAGNAAEPVAMTYDGLYRPLTITDARNQTTTYTYNGVTGFLDQVTYPGGESIGFFYDVLGRTIKRTDPRGLITYFSYHDPDGLLTGIGYANPPHQGIDPDPARHNVTFTYDEAGRLSERADASGGTVYTYDARSGALSSVGTHFGSASSSLSSLGYTYYPDGSRRSLALPDGGAFTYAYDVAGRLSALTNPQNETTAWTYLENDWLHRRTLANGAEAVYGYNSLGQVTSLTNLLPAPFGNPPLVLSAFNLTYTPAGQRQQMTASAPYNAVLAGTSTYTYDEQKGGQLLREHSTRNGGYDHAFNYDLAGNALNFRGVTRQFNLNNQTTSAFAPGSNLGTSPVHDANGNPIRYSNGNHEGGDIYTGCIA